MKGSIDEAAYYLDKINTPINVNIISNLCVVATRGLIKYRLGKIEEGRKLYHYAIDSASKLKDQYHVSIAILNFLREDINFLHRH